MQNQAHQNVARKERWISIGAGSLLAVVGLQRRSFPGLILAGIGAAMIHRGVTGTCNLYSALGINTADDDGAQPEDFFDRGIHVVESQIIAKPPRELYDYWRQLDNLPRLMSHLDSVTVIDETRSHWVAKAPAVVGGQVEWDAEIINDEPNLVIAWKSLPGADVDNTGSVRFIDAGDGRTEVRVTIEYLPPAGRLGKWIATLFGEEPHQQVRDDLLNFKQTMESGSAAAST
jgi:uncharacterized membrane protein